MKYLFLAASLLVVCSCRKDDSSAKTSSPTDKQALVVGFSQVGADNDWRTAETESIRSEATKRGIDLKFSDAQEKQENQIKALRNFLAQHVDAIILAPVVEAGWDPVLKEIQKAKIPVVLVDRGIATTDDSLYETLIASDFVDEGHRAAAWLTKRLNGKGNIVEIEGTTGSAPAIDRHKGFMDELAQSPGLKIIKSQSGDFKRSNGKEVMEAFLKADGKNINAVYSHNDAMALGAIQAIEEAGLKPGVDIVVVSIDGIKDAFKSIIDGKMNCTVECNPLLGPAAYDAVEALHAGKSLPKKTIVQDAIFDTSNAKEAFPSRKY